MSNERSIPPHHAATLDRESVDGGPAFPHQWDWDTGMTLRDYFAGQAISIFQRKVIIEVTAHNGGCTPKQIGDALCEQVATSAYLIADAMIKARSATS